MAVRAKKTFIKFLKSSGQVDHQIRRAFVEIACIQVVAEDFSGIEATQADFHEIVGGAAYSSDEYAIIDDIKNAIANKENKQLEKVAKKPLFGFLDNEIVKPFKMFAASPPASFNSGGVIVSSGASENAKKKALDSLLL